MHAVGASADMPQRTTCDISTQTELQHKLDICIQTDHFIECNSHCANSCNSSAFDEPHFENSKENEVLSPIAIEDLEFIENQTVDSSLNDGENAETPTESEESISIEYEGVFTDTPIEYNGGTPEGIANDNVVHNDSRSSTMGLGAEFKQQYNSLQVCQNCIQLKLENEHLFKKLRKITLCQDALKCNEKLVSFYTGLPNYTTLSLLVESAAASLPVTKTKLSVFQQILIVLIKLRLNLEEQDLAFRFEVSQPTVSRLFNKWISALAQILSPLIRWPNKEERVVNLPEVFKRFFADCTCIIDCTEIFIERPSNLTARSQTWSNYKQHNTAKVLIGTISYISKAWGGRVSDKFISEQSGFLDKIMPGDLVLADRGFTIEDSIGLYCAKVCTPPFTNGGRETDHTPRSRLVARNIAR